MFSFFESKNYFSGVFLDVAQQGVAYCSALSIIILYLFASLYQLIRSHLVKRTFKIRHGNSFPSFFFFILAGVSQGNEHFPDLYNIFNSDIPQTQNTILATYDDDTSILSSSSRLDQYQTSSVSDEASMLFNTILTLQIIDSQTKNLKQMQVRLGQAFYFQQQKYDFFLP